MKQNITFLTLTLLLTATSHAGLFNNEDKIDSRIKELGGIVINQPKFGGNPILANTSDEAKNLSYNEDHEIQAKRLKNFCQSLGYNSPVIVAAVATFGESEFIDFAMGLDGTTIINTPIPASEHGRFYVPKYFIKIGCLNRSL